MYTCMYALRTHKIISMFITHFIRNNLLIQKRFFFWILICVLVHTNWVGGFRNVVHELNLNPVKYKK